MSMKPETIALLAGFIWIAAIAYAGFSTPQTQGEKAWERAEFLNK